MTKTSRFFLVTFLLTALFAPTAGAQKKSKDNFDWRKVKVLLYTKNGKGYVHENIPYAVKCVEKLSREYGFALQVADSSNAFSEENLKTVTLVMFASTNNDVFATDDQRLAFRRYIEAGGGFVGLHSVIGTERNWTWFKMMLGGSFAWHPKFQKYKIQVIDPQHASVKDLPTVWEREDECYFQKEMYPGIRTLLAHDLRTLNNEEREKITASAGPFSPFYPACWYQVFDGGTIWITALGHDKKDYEDPTFVKHILQGMRFVAGESKTKDQTKAYAVTKDDALRIENK